MARRRVNIRFVTILGGGLLGVAGLLFAAKKLLIKERPDRYIAAAKEAQAAHNPRLALANWAAALKISSTDPVIYTGMGDALHDLALEDPDVNRKEADRKSWERALEIDTGYVPAVKSLVHYWRDRRTQAPSLDAFRNARDRAEQLHRLAPNDPEDSDVQAFLYTTTIDGWLAGLETDPARLADAEKQIHELEAKNPSNSDLPFHLAELDIHRGTDLTRSSLNGTQPAAATAQFRKSQADMTDALKAQPDNAAMHFAAARIYYNLADTDRSMPDSKQHYGALAEGEIDKAIALLKPADPQFVDISLGIAQIEMFNNNLPKAQAIVSALLAAKGSDPQVDVRAAALVVSIPELQPSTMATLQTALDAGSKPGPVDARHVPFLLALTELQISQFSSATGDERAKLHETIKQHLQMLEDAGLLHPAGLARMQATFAVEDRDPVRAIQILTRSINSDPLVGQDPDLMLQLARLYIDVRQLEQAKEWLAKTIARVPLAVEPRKMLVRILADENTESARRQMSEQIDFLVHATPNDPEVIEFQILRLNPGVDNDLIRALYAKLPEQTVGQAHSKAFVAIRKLNDYPEAERLLGQAIQSDPKDVRDMVLLADVYARNDQKPQAVDVVTKGLAANPDDPSLLIVQKKLSNATPAEMQQFVTQLESQNADPVQRELTLASTAQQNHDLKGVETHLKAAEALKPDNIRVSSDLFDFYLRNGQLDKIEPYLAKLTEANADQAHGRLYQFAIARQKNDPVAMMNIAQQLTADLPEFAQSYYCMGQAWQAKGDYQRAIDNFDTALQKKQDLIDARLAKIDCLYQLNHLEEARQTIDDSVRRFPDNPQFKQRQIDYALTYGNPDDAARSLATDLQNNPNSPEVRLHLASADMRIAAIKLSTNDTEGANASATSARDLLLEGIKLFPDDSRFYGQLADVLSKGGDNADAEKTLLTLDARPNWQTRPEPQEMLAGFYGQTRQFDKAEACFQNALARSNDNPNVVVAYSNLLAEERKFDSALAMLGGITPQTPELDRQAINLMLAAHRFDDAQAAIAHDLESNPPDAATLQAAWGHLLLESGKPDGALDHATKALALDGRNAEALLLRGQVHLATVPPDSDAAIADLSLAHDISPASAEILVSLADAYEARSNAPDAARSLESAIRLQRTNSALRMRLAKMYVDMQPQRLDDAMRILREGIALPNGSTDPALANGQALVYQAMGKVDQGLQVATDALAKNPHDARLGRTYFELLGASKQYPLLLSQSEGQLKGDKTFWWIWSARGQAHAALGDMTQATSDFNSALAAADAVKDADAAQAVIQQMAKSIGYDQAIACTRDRVSSGTRWSFALVLLYHGKGDDASAIAALQPLLDSIETLPPGQQIPRLQLAGMVYSSARPNPDNDKAYAAYVQLLKVDPDNLAALNNIACLCADGFKPPKVQEGLAYIRHAIDLLKARNGADPLVNDTYGWLLILGGNSTEGMDVLHKALEHQSFPEGHYHLAEGYLRMNRPEDAQREVQAALEAIAKAQQNNQTVDPLTRAKIDDVSTRVLSSLRVRTSSNVP